MPRVVVVGASFAGLYAAKGLRRVADVEAETESALVVVPWIDAEKIDSVFQRYFSLRPEDGIGSDRAVEHSGLGLWIVRRNVEALGGQVVAANRPGGGLSIRMVLPRFVIH